MDITLKDLVRKNLERVQSHPQWLDNVLDNKEDRNKLLEIITLCLNDDSYLSAIYSTALIIATSHPSLVKDIRRRLAVVEMIKLIGEE